MKIFKVRLWRNPGFSMSKTYEKKIFIFDRHKLEEFIYFIKYFHNTLEATASIHLSGKISYLSYQIRG